MTSDRKVYISMKSDKLKRYKLLYHPKGDIRNNLVVGLGNMGLGSRQR